MLLWVHERGPWWCLDPSVRPVAMSFGAEAGPAAAELAKGSHALLEAAAPGVGVGREPGSEVGFGAYLASVLPLLCEDALAVALVVSAAGGAIGFAHLCSTRICPRPAKSFSKRWVKVTNI